MCHKGGSSEGLTGLQEPDAAHLPALGTILFPKGYVEVITPGSYECDLIWKYGLLCRCHQGKMRLRWRNVGPNPT